ncbi:MAG: aryl-sulfate sulfotransferase [Myxococcota bacterium]
MAWQRGWLAGLVLSLGCTPETNEMPPEQIQPIEADGLNISIDRVPNELALMASIESKQARTVSFTASAEGIDLATPETALVASQSAEVPILGLFPATWTITAIVDGKPDAQWSLTTERPADFVDSPTETFGNTFPPEETICASRERRVPAYACTDRRGEPNFYVPLPFNAMFVRPLSDGTFLAHPDGGEQLWRFDRLGRDLGSLTVDELVAQTNFRIGAIDEHEVVEILEGPWAGAWAVLMYSYDESVEKVGAGIVVYDPVKGELLWDWSAHGTPDDGESVDSDRLPYERWGVQEHGEDWLHANALVHGTDSQGDFFWMSLRHQDWIIEIRAPSGEVTMQLGAGGDVDLLDGQVSDWFFHQHAHELKRRSDREFEVLVFDNGNERPGVDEPRTRIVEYLVDREAKTATTLLDIETDFFAPAAGDADRMPTGDNLLVTRAVGDAFVAEFTRDGSRRWSQSIPREGEVYRAEFYPSLYQTAWSAQTGW